MYIFCKEHSNTFIWQHCLLQTTVENVHLATLPFEKKVHLATLPFSAFCKDHSKMFIWQRCLLQTTVENVHLATLPFATIERFRRKVLIGVAVIKNFDFVGGESRSRVIYCQKMAPGVDSVNQFRP
jgi:hypothetical protein